MSVKSMINSDQAYQRKKTRVVSAVPGVASSQTLEVSLSKISKRKEERRNQQMDYFNNLSKPMEYKSNPVSKFITATSSTIKETSTYKV